MQKGISGTRGRNAKQHWETDSHFPFSYTKFDFFLKKPKFPTKKNYNPN